MNVLIGNADAHAKNIALVHGPGGSIALAPAYDLMSTTFSPTVSTIAGMRINALRDIDAVTPDDLVAEADAWGIPTARAEERVRELIAAVPAAIAATCDRIDAPESLVAHLNGRARGLLARRAQR